MKKSPFLIAGWKEWVALPDLGIPAIKAKLDTGAATSSIHAHDIKYFDIDGKKHVEYTICPLVKNRKVLRRLISPLHDQRIVKSSNGDSEQRPVVKTLLKIGAFVWEIELNLTNRDYMGMRMLIGREAIKDNMLINCSHKFLHCSLSTIDLKKLYI